MKEKKTFNEELLNSLNDDSGNQGFGDEIKTNRSKFRMFLCFVVLPLAIIAIVVSAVFVANRKKEISLKGQFIFLFLKIKI